METSLSLLLQELEQAQRNLERLVDLQPSEALSRDFFTTFASINNRILRVAQEVLQLRDKLRSVEMRIPVEGRERFR